MTNSTTFPGTVTATTFVGSGASLTSIPAGQIIGSFSGNTAFDTTTLVVDATNNRVGVGTTTPQKTLEVAGPMRITDGLSNVCDLSIGLVQASSGLDTGTRFLSPNATSGNAENFGISPAISDDGKRFIVGDPAKKLGGTEAGAAYIFTKSNGSWDTGTMIQASDKQAYDAFGFQCDISADGTKVLVGARAENSYAGAVYYFTYNSSSSSWSQQQKITSPSSGTQPQFGFALKMSASGTTAVVGEPYGNDNYQKGYVYPMSHNGSAWVRGSSNNYHNRLQASDAQSYDSFGRFVSISDDGNTIVAGAPSEDTGGTSAGAAYIFQYNGSTWSQQQKLQASDKQAGDNFGTYVELSGDGTTLVVGAYGEDTGASANGAAYIFTYNGSSSWSQTSKIQAPNAQQNLNFGNGLAITSNGTKLVVGAPSLTVGGTAYIGAAYIFINGTLNQTLLGHSDDYAFGRCAITRDGKSILMGSPYSQGSPGPDSEGAAYIYAPPSSTGLASSTAISAAGTALSFTGQHMCVPEGPMYRGLVVSANKNRYVSLNGTLTTGAGAIRSSESLPVVSLSNVVSDRSVFGVVDRLEQGGTTERRQVVGATVVTAQKEMGDNRVIVNSLGEGAIWVADTNGPLVSGDYMTTSHLTGYSQKQDDDILHNSTVAKITMDCDFNPDDVPIQVIKKKDTGDNDLDPYGRIQWEEHPLKTTQKAYNIRYLTVDGNRTDEANAVHRSALVGCTYHCG